MIGEWWRHLPEQLDPIAFVVGSFSLRWYSLLFLLGWAASFFFLARRLWEKKAPVGKEGLSDIALLVLVGAIVGGRLGYAAFYDPALFAAPLSLASPFDASGRWTGIWGMSFHGALVGVAFALVIFSKLRKIDFWALTDFLVPVVPIALFFGRMGNFFNLELVGRETSRSWGMSFPGLSGLRHPSQLYEAFFEGVILFVFLRFMGKRRLREGMLSALFIASYGIMRFFLEFFREPDAGVALLFGWMTRGQTLSLVIITFAALFSFYALRKDAILKRS